MGEAWSLLGLREGLCSTAVFGDWGDLEGVPGLDTWLLGWLWLLPWPARKPAKALPWTLARGLSIAGIRVGSYSNFCSRANIVLFFTREAFCKRSIDERLVGEGDPPRPP